MAGLVEKSQRAVESNRLAVVEDGPLFAGGVAAVASVLLAGQA